ncbi:MAG TPA: hypothetical protein VF590_10520, partial [Isosphaeraceae bacterium]
MTRSGVLGMIGLVLCAPGPSSLRAQPGGSGLREDAARALKRAASFYRDRVASHGGYVYYYSE